MEKVRTWCGQASDRGRLKNRTEQLLYTTFQRRWFVGVWEWGTFSAVAGQYIVDTEITMIDRARRSAAADTKRWRCRHCRRLHQHHEDDSI